MSMKLKKLKMKSLDISCASPASTAICNGTKSIQRLNSYLGDQYKSFSPRAPCISELPFTPRPSTFTSYREKTRKLGAPVKHSDAVMRRNSSADVSDIKRYSIYKNSFEGVIPWQTPYGKQSSVHEGVRRDWSNQYNDETSHLSRCLLSESSLDSLNKEDTRKNKNFSTKKSTSSPAFGSEGRRSCSSRVETRRFGSMLDEEKEKIKKHFSLIDVSDNNNNNLNSRNKVITKSEEKTSYNGHDSQRHKSMGRCRNDSLVQKSRHQVVVLRVSLHCKGCEGKLRKHLHKMEGVTSFSIDLETKKVTVIGKVTPLDVLTSISKVKNAQFWPSPASTLSTSSSSRSSSSTSSSSIVEYN